jgi:hypothetical protein
MTDIEKTEKPEKQMTYEEYLDEVTTLLTEMYDLSDDAAIKYVMRAQAANFFVLHDEHVEMRNPSRAMHDAKLVYEQRNKSRPEIYRK